LQKIEKMRNQAGDKRTAKSGSPKRMVKDAPIGRGRSNRDDKPSRDEAPKGRGRSSRDDKPTRKEAPEGKGRYTRDEKPTRSETPKSRGYSSRDDKPTRKEAPKGRGRNSRDEMPTRSETFKSRGYSNMDEKPTRSETPKGRGYSSRDDKPTRKEAPEGKGRYARDEKPTRSEAKGRGYSSRDEKPFRSNDFSSKPKTPSKPPKDDGLIRLNRFLSNSGVCSRREADKYIETGCVTVNGKIVSELGVKVSLNDDVRFNGKILNPENKVYLLLNKPKGYVTTTDDPQERKTVMDLIADACKERIYPVGRLDLNTSGLLLFTNDGEMSKRLTHPSHNVKKIYHVSLDKPLTKNHLLEIAKGVELEDGFVSPDAISYIGEEEKNEVGIEIHSGKNRIVRRIFEHLGYEVKKLDRVYFAGLTKKNIARGKWRFLSFPEINHLKML
jgi:23S rRNA pseudouridine2605 synthase